MVETLEGNFRLVSKEEEQETRYLTAGSNEIAGDNFDKPSTVNPYAGTDADLDDLFYKNEDNISAIKKYYFKRFGEVKNSR